MFSVSIVLGSTGAVSLKNITCFVRIHSSPYLPLVLFPAVFFFFFFISLLLENSVGEKELCEGVSLAPWYRISCLFDLQEVLLRPALRTSAAKACISLSLVS